MINKTIISFFDNLKQKSTNPFLGTLVFVWGVHNWRFVFTFFNFDRGVSREKKIEILASYFVDKSFILGLGEAALWSIIAINATYLLLNISRFFIQFYDKWLTPRILKQFDKSQIVSRKEFDNEKSEKERFEILYESEKQKKYEIQKQLDTLEEKYESLLLNSASNSNNEVNPTILHDDQTYIESEYDKEIKLLKTNFKHEEIERAMTEIGQQKRHKQSSEVVNWLLNRNYIDIKSKNEFSTTYIFTPKGNALKLSYFKLLDK